MYPGSRVNYLGLKVSLSFSPYYYSIQIINNMTQVRGIGTSLATATNWAGNLLIGSTYLSLMAKVTPAGAFGFYAGLCLLGWFFVLGCFPETAGLSLEEVKMVFKTGFGIKESQRLRHTKAEIRLREKSKRSLS